MGRDFADIGSERGVADARAHFDAEASKPNGVAAKNFKFQLVSYADIPELTIGQWTIKRLLPARGLAVVYGPPGCGKSFLVLDAVLHIAAGIEYVGQAVRQLRVVYIVAEGQGSFGSRVKAAGKALGLPRDARFHLIAVAPDLGRANGDAARLIEEVKAQLRGKTPGVVVIDTLSQTMCGADENGPGMGAFIVNAGAIAEALDCLVIAVHHTGKDEARGMRGWSGLHGACDAEWEVAKGEDGRHTVCVPKMKDGQDGWAWSFRLPQVEIGHDEDGDSVTTCVVELTSEPAIQTTSANLKAKAERKSRSQDAFEQAFNETMSDCAQNYYVDGDQHALVQAVHVEQIRPYFARRWAVDEPDKRKRQRKVSGAFCAVLKNLPHHYKIRATEEVEWIWRLSR